MRYQPIYMPATDGEPPTAPIFDTEEEAEEWIENESRECKIKIDIDKDGLCHACMAEWSVDEILN
jgi:hypothetical protein